ncbi:MAG: TolC family protein [Porticoccaceae bacterium]
MARRLANTILLIAIGLGTGCNLAPGHEPPLLPTAPTYPGLPGESQQAAIALGWRQFFADPSLQNLIERALGDNRDLRIATQRIEEARAFYGIQRTDQFPSVGAGAAAARERVPAELSPSGRALTAGQYQATLNLNAWELDFWGRVRNLKEAALENYLATDAAQRAIAISLIRQVADTYLVASEFDERIQLARRTIATREESYRIARRRYEVGAASRIDAAQAETLLTQARSEWVGLERLREQNRNALVLLVGSPVAIDIQPLALNEANFRQDLGAGLPSDLLLNRPDILVDCNV